MDSEANLAASSGETTPGVSTKTTCVSPLVQTVLAAAARVVWRRCEYGHAGKPATALISVDLPALGTPTTHARSDRLPGRHSRALSGSPSSLLSNGMPNP